jgi:hypothetical protein
MTVIKAFGYADDLVLVGRSPDPDVPTKISQMQAVLDKVSECIHMQIKTKKTYSLH